MNHLHIVTVATDSEYYFPYLVESCKRNNKELTVLGYGEKWKGFNWKYRLMIEYLKGLNHYDIVCFIDGYDVICTRDLNELENEFIKIKNKTNSKIIVGNEKIIKGTFFYYLSNILFNIYFGKCKDLNINTGTYIGYVIDLLEILQNIYNLNPNDTADDQKLLIKYCNMHNNDIFIDTDNKLFLTFGKPYSEIDYLIQVNNNGIIYNNNKPFFIHAPGQTYLDNTIRLLGYNLNNNNIKKKMIERNVKKIVFIIKDNLIVILIVLFIVLFIFYYTIKFYKKKLYFL